MPSTTDNEEKADQDAVVFKMPPSKPPPKKEEHQQQQSWVSAAEFSGVASSIEWDSLLLRGSGLPASKDFTRDSLFVKFDPLTRKRDTVAFPPLTKQVRSPEEQNDAVLAEGQNEAGDEEQNSETIKIFNGPPDLAVLDFVDEAVNDENEVSSSPSPEKENVFQEPDDETGKTEEEWVSATEFTGATSSIEWDMLLTRGGGGVSNFGRDFGRDSLFVKFDPLAEANPRMEQLVEESVVDNGNFESFLTAPSVEENIEEVEDEQQKINASATEIETEVENGGGGDQEQEQEAIADENEVFLTVKPEVERVEEQNPMIDAINLLKAKIADKMKEYEFVKEQHEQNLLDIAHIKLETKAAKEDLNDMEAAFADVLLSYESGKAYQKNFEANEKVLTTRATELEHVLQNGNEKYEEIERKSEEMREIVKRDAEAQMKKMENENFKLRASLKMADLKVHKLENEIDHITTESNNLQKMCDEMIQGCV